MGEGKHRPPSLTPAQLEEQDFWLFVMRAWPLLLADFRREYRMDSDAIAGLSLQEFLWLLQGLSDASRWRTAWNHAPKHMHNPDDRAALIAAARR